MEKRVKRDRRGTLHVEGRRWWQRGPGNTYCSVRIWRSGTLLATLAPTYGYGDHYLTVAFE